MVEGFIAADLLNQIGLQEEPPGADGPLRVAHVEQPYNLTGLPSGSPAEQIGWEASYSQKFAESMRNQANPAKWAHLPVKRDGKNEGKMRNLPEFG